MQAQSSLGDLILHREGVPDTLHGATCPDVYFTSGYGASAATIDVGTWHCAALDDRVLLPYIEREVNEHCSDAASPYGYCGLHVAEDLSERELASFWQELREFWKATGLITAFLRFSPMDLRSVRMASRLDGLHLTRRGDTALVPVDQGPDAAWKAMEGRSRTAIRKAEKSGFSSRLRPVHPDDIASGSTFRRLYEGTMARVGSSSKYLFTDEYYQQLLHGLGPALLMAEVCDSDSVIVAASLVMTHQKRAHYHLAGSNPDAARLGANNLLVWTIIRWAAAEGMDLVHLGGGLTADDNLFRFKKSFGGRAAEFWTGTAVLDENQYRVLAEERASRAGIPSARLRHSSFFPLYRAEFGHGS